VLDVAIFRNILFEQNAIGQS